MKENYRVRIVTMIAVLSAIGGFFMTIILIEGIDAGGLKANWLYVLTSATLTFVAIQFFVYSGKISRLEFLEDKFYEQNRHIEELEKEIENLKEDK